MNQSSIDPLSLSRKLVRVLIALNLAMGVGIIALLAASLIAPDFVMQALGVNPAKDASTTVTGMRMIMVIGILSAPLAHVILTRLLAIVETVRVGPFIARNAERLRTMGWALLGLEALHIAVGLVGSFAFSADQPVTSGWSFSATRYLAVLMLFVLARVFEQGVHMREDLEGTV